MSDLVGYLIIAFLAFGVGALVGVVAFVYGQSFYVDRQDKEKLNPPLKTVTQEPVNPYKNYKPGRTN